MQANARVLLVCLSLCGGIGYGQSQSGSSSSSEAVPKWGYVRRFSGGLTLGVLGLSYVTGNSTSATSGSVTNTYSTTNATKRIGYGITGQVAITNHVTLSASALVRPLGYQMSTTIDTTTTSSAGVTTTTTTGAHEDTRARGIEVPVTIRYYVKSRLRKGPHFFGEGGVALLDATHARTSIDTTDSGGNASCCTVSSGHLANRSVRGYVAGMGVQIIDPIGIRVVPEVRYTRWGAETFHLNSTGTQRNQLEAVISLTF